jgi:hypothetical protein
MFMLMQMVKEYCVALQDCRISSADAKPCLTFFSALSCSSYLFAGGPPLCALLLESVELIKCVGSDWFYLYRSRVHCVVAILWQRPPPPYHSVLHTHHIFRQPLHGRGQMGFRVVRLVSIVINVHLEAGWSHGNYSRLSIDMAW